MGFPFGRPAFAPTKPIEAGERVLAMPEKPWALFVTTDNAARGMVQRLLARELPLPEDVAVVGYEDVPFVACSRVSLTAVSIPVRQVGQLAAELLFDRMEGTGTRERQQMLSSPEFAIWVSCP